MKMKPRYNLPRQLLSVLFFFVYAGFSGENSTEIFALIEKGDIENARKLTAETDSANISTESIFTRALLSEDAQKAAELYKKISGDEKFEDHFRIEAMLRLAETADFRKEYDKSYNYICEALAMNRDDRLLFRQAAAAVRSGKYDMAKTVISSITTDSLRKTALRYFKERNPSAAKIPDNRKTSVYSLQVGAFSDRKNAEHMTDKIEKRFSDVKIIEELRRGRIYYKVVVGSFETKEDARIFGEHKLDSDFYIIKRPEKI